MKDLYMFLPFAALIFVSLSGAQQQILSDENEICRLLQDHITLRKPGTCSSAIQCIDRKSVPYMECTSPVQHFNKDTLKCAKISSDTYCKSPCEKSSPTYVVDPKNCNSWYKCDGEETITTGSCNDGLVFDQKSQLCVYASQSTCQATYKVCDLLPRYVPFKDEENCNKYNTCNLNSKEVTKICDPGNYYDVELGECQPKGQVQCNKHPYPDGACDEISDRFISDDVTCRGYFYCSGKPKPTPQWNHCSELYFFNEEKQACMDKALVKCNKDRCDGIAEGKIISGRPGCQHYLVCENNKTVEEIQCPQGNYYDPYVNTCTNQIQSYIACKS